jgi:Domain of unknown function (DUF4412)
MIIALTFALLGSGPAAPAGRSKPMSVFFEQTATTNVDGKAGAPVRSRVFWRGQSVRMESGDLLQPEVLLLDLARNRAVRLDGKTKTAAVLDMAALRSHANLEFSMAGDAAGADDADRMRTVPIEGTRTIAGYVCEGHRIRGRSLSMDVWTSTAVPVPMSLFTDFLEWSGAAQSMGGLLPEIEKIGGFPMQTRSRLTVGSHTYETLATIVQIKTEPLAATLFETPAGYHTVDAPASEPEP